MRAAEHQVGRTHQHGEAVTPGRFGGFEPGREFGDRDAVAHRLLDMLDGRVVMAGQGDIPAFQRLDDHRPVAVAILLLRLLLGLHIIVHLIVVQAVAALVVLAVLVEIDELPLPRRVVHQGNQADHGIVHEGPETLHQARTGDFAAQVQEMLGAQHAPPHRRLYGIRHARKMFRARVIAAADPHGVERRRDSGGGELAVMGQHCGLRRPLDAGARRELALQIVRVELDKAGQQVVALEVERRAGADGPLADLREPAVNHLDGAGHDIVPRHDPGVGNGQACHHAASLAAVSGTVRVATASRTSESWKIPTIAAPRRTASRMRPIAASRFSLSSDAVGSSSSSTG